LNDCKRLKRLTNEEQDYYIIINNVEIIACKLELFKNPIINIINQEISVEREGSIAIVSAP
jgi:hypothetical protein